MMDGDRLSAMDALRFGCDTYSQDSGYCLGFLSVLELSCLMAGAVIAFHLVLVAQLLFQLDAPPLDSYVCAFFIAYAIVRAGAQPLVSKWLLALQAGNRLSYDELLGQNLAEQFPITVKMLAATFIYTIISFFGSLLLIVPGLVGSSTLRFYRFAVLDPDRDVSGSLRASYDLCAENVGALVGLNLLCGLVKFLGLCLFGVGLLPACAVCGLAEAYAYRKLSYEKHSP